MEQRSTAGAPYFTLTPSYYSFITSLPPSQQASHLRDFVQWHNQKEREEEDYADMAGFYYKAFILRDDDFSLLSTPPTIYSGRNHPPVKYYN